MHTRVSNNILLNGFGNFVKILWGKHYHSPICRLRHDRSVGACHCERFATYIKKRCCKCLAKNVGKAVLEINHSVVARATDPWFENR